MKKTVLAALICCTLSYPAIAEKAPSAGPEDNRIRYVTYSEDQVVRVEASYGASTMIVFGKNEKIETIAAGDAMAWKIEPNKEGNILFLKPVEKKADANLNVVTNKRQYVFLLTAAFRPKNKQVYKIAFRYPDEEPGGLLDEAVERASKPNLANLNVANTNSRYGYKGSSRIKPIAAFDDGVKTFFRFKGEVPAIFAVDADRNESLVNMRKEGEFMVIDRVSLQWTLRSGDEQTCVFNLRSNNIEPPTGFEPYNPPPPRVPGVKDAVSQ